MKTIEDIEKYAKDNYVPIARRQTVKYLIDLIQEKEFTSFLEIGTAIGYTSIVLAKTFPNLKITTIEHNEKRAQLAKENFNQFDLTNRIDFIITDAENYSLKQIYDLIFIDASKKKNRLFLDKFSHNLKENGIIIVDNMKLEDFWVNANEKKKTKYDQINQEFKDYVFSSTKYQGTLKDDVGDGIMVITLNK